jgi:carboxymethylenebutenolidase
MGFDAVLCHEPTGARLYAGRLADSGSPTRRLVLMGLVTYPGRHGRMAGYLAVPTGDGPWPGVVVIHDILGMTGQLRAHTERFADKGYMALAPDLYSWGRWVRCVMATMTALRARTGRAFDDIDAARVWLAAQDKSSGRIGVAGYCMGGGFALLLAAPRFRFSASAVNYGEVPSDVETILMGACPIVGNFGGRDGLIKPGAAARLADAVDSLSIDHDVKEYPSARHSFMDDYGRQMILLKVFGIGYDAEAAEDAWTRTLAFFDEHLL